VQKSGRSDHIPGGDPPKQAQKGPNSLLGNEMACMRGYILNPAFTGCSFVLEE